VITGIIDAPRTGGLPKAIEIYVINSVADLSIYKVQSYGNGGTTPSAPLALTGSATAGQYLYVASESPEFTAYFGFAPTVTGSVLNVNGDDVVALTKNDTVVDVFGTIGVRPVADATFNYQDTWFYRKSNTAPSPTFNLADWTFPTGQSDALDSLGSSGVNPAVGNALRMPIGTFTSGSGGTGPTISGFSPSSGAVGTSVTISGSNFSSPTVKFNGTTATITASTATSITATVPSGATSGKITVEVAGQTTATSATDFTVVAAGAPLVAVSPTSATGLTNYVGQVSASTNYTVTGTNLVSDLVVTASTNAIEVSTNSSTGFTNSFSLAPSGDGTVTKAVYVRISSSAPAGPVNATVSNVSGVASNNFTVSGTVTQPALTLVLATNSVAENAGANATTGTVGIPASLGTDLVVNLVSTNTAAATVPASVTITNGTTNAIFDIAAVANSSSYGPATTAIEASNSSYTTASATLTVTNVDVPPAPLAIKGWINEFHYDPSTTNDAGEFLEIVLAPGTSSDVSLVFYNGGTSAASAAAAIPYNVTPLGGTSVAAVPFSLMTAGTSTPEGYRLLSVSFADSNFQNGNPDGVALIIDGVVEEFLSYEGVMTASTGAAAGYTSTDCKVSETQATPNTSIQRVGPGSRAADFAWIAGAASSKGSANSSQNLGATAVQGTGTLAIANATPSSPYVTQNIFPKATAGQTVSLTLTGTLSSGTISAMSVVVPAAFTELSVGNVTVSGAGAGTAVTTLSGSTLTVTGLVVDQLNPVTINIAGLTTPETETAGDLTKDGNYPFTVQTGVDGNLQPLLIQPIAVVTIPIANLGDVDANGVSLDVGKTVAVQGVCTEENFNSTSSTSAYLQSGQPDGIRKAGINIYSGQRNLFVRGNEYVVTGSVLNYNGLTELVVAASSQVVGLGTAAAVPTPVTLTIDQLTAAHEAYEGSLVRVVGLSKVSGTWALTVVGTTTSGSNIILANGGVNLTARLNAGSTALAEPIYPAAITGVYGQFVAAPPYTGGGQIQPRDQADIEDAPGLRLALGFNQINEGGSFTSETLTISRTGGSVGSVSGVLSAGTLGKIQVMEGGVAQQLPYSFTLADGVASTTLTIEAIDNSVYGGDVNVVLTATDSASSNPLSSASVTLTILEDETAAAPDTTKPVITLLGANPLSIANGATYTDPGAKVTDNVDAERTITGSGTVNTAVQGDYTVTYNATDAAGNVADAVTRTVRVAAPVVVESTYAEWSGGAALDSAGLAKYAIGGASSLTANDGVKPTTALTGGFLVITAIVRTDNSNLTVVGQAVTDLANYASGTGVTTVNGVETTDQTGVPTGHKRKTFSVAQGSDARKFMRLSASLALSGVNTTVTVAKDSGGATFLQVTGATAGATSGGTATSEKRTVYYFAPDTNSSPTYTGSDWPYVIVQGQLSAGAGVTATLTKNSSGMLLVNGLPAYQYGGDSGSTTANGVSSAWPAMRADGTKTTTGPSGTLQ
jgi:hypothetical protein